MCLADGAGFPDNLHTHLEAPRNVDNADYSHTQDSVPRQLRGGSELSLFNSIIIKRVLLAEAQHRRQHTVFGKGKGIGL